MTQSMRPDMSDQALLAFLHQAIESLHVTNDQSLTLIAESNRLLGLLDNMLEPLIKRPV